MHKYFRKQFSDSSTSVIYILCTKASRTSKLLYIIFNKDFSNKQFIVIFVASGL